MTMEPAQLLAASEFAEAINLELGETQAKFGIGRESGVNLWHQTVTTENQVFHIIVTATDRE